MIYENRRISFKYKLYNLCNYKFIIINVFPLKYKENDKFKHFVMISKSVCFICIIK